MWIAKQETLKLTALSGSYIVNAEFPRNLRDGQRVIDHLLDGLLLELRSIGFPFGT